MTFKEIVVHMNDTPSALNRLELALRLAADHDAHVVGLGIVDVPPLPTYVYAELPSSIVEKRFETERERAALVGAQFEQQCVATQATANSGREWRVAEGETGECLSVHARRADLLVTGLRDTDDAGSDWQRTLAQVLLAAGSPLLLVPPKADATSAPRYVTVGWDGSREAARAVQDALPLLRRAESVSIACVPTRSTPQGTGSDIPGADLAHYLARHGVSAEAQTASRDGQRTGKALLAWAKAQGADLLVMGGYGHGGVRELMLGGVTKHVLENAEIPVFMSH